MTFDPTTLMTAAILILTISGLVTAANWRVEKGSGTLLWWGAAFLLGAAGFGLLMAGGLQSARALPRELANIAFLFAYGCALTAARRLGGKRAAPSLLLAGGICWMVIAWVIDFDPAWRMTLASMMVAAYSLAAAGELWRASLGTPARRACAIAFGLHGAFFVLRTLLGPTFGFTAHWSEHATGTWSAIMACETLAFAAALSILVTAIAREQSALRMAHEDPLTGIGNRRAFTERAQRLIARSGPGAVPPVLMLLDLDGFKHVNDRFGHDAGDRVLIAFVEAVKTRLDAPDLFWRLGGDEFAILLQGKSLNEAQEIAERLRLAVALQNPFVLSAEVTVTVTMGLAVAEPGMTLASLMEQADRQLYEGKRAGRNCVRVQRLSEVAQAAA